MRFAQAICPPHATLLVLVAAFGLLGSAAPAEAQSSRQMLEMARTHMEQGQDLYARGRYVEAAEEFLAAYQAREFSAFLFNAALCYERYGDPARAADYYQRYLDREPQASDRAAVTAKITALRAQIAPPQGEAVAAGGATGVAGTPPGGEAGATPSAGSGTEPTPPVDPGSTTSSAGSTPEAPPATPPATPPEDMKSLLSVQTQPEGATVFVRSGAEVVATGPSPFAHTLDEGEYQLSIEHPSYRTVTQPIRVRAGKVYVVIIEMSQALFLGYLRVVSNPPGARVFVDDREAGSHPAPYANEIPTGVHRVWVERAGYETVEREVEVGLGEQVELRVDLERVAFGRIRMVANVRPAEVYVDGTRVGNIPYEGELPAGRRRIRVTADGMKDFEQTVTIVRGQVTPIRVRLRPAVERGNAYATLTFATAGLGGGIALSVLSNRLRDDLDAEQALGTLADDDPRISQGRALSIGADVAYGLSGLVGIVSVYLFVHDPTPDSEGTLLEPRDWALLPVWDPATGTAAVSFGGRF